MTRVGATRIVSAALAVLCLATTSLAHPFHESIGEANFRRQGNVIEVSLRLNPEDLESALETMVGVPVDLDDPDSELALLTYLKRNFVVSAEDAEPNRQPRLVWVGRELEADWAWLHFEIRIPRRSDVYDLTNTILFEHADDQRNTLNFFIDAELTTLTFTPDDPTQRLPILTGGDGVTPIKQFETRGTGPTRLVLLPGIGLPGSMWNEFMTRNNDRYTMHAITLPGIGGTPAPPPAPSQSGTLWIDNAVEAVVQLVEEQGWHDAALLGHSLGGHIALRAAAARSDLFGPVVSFEGFPLVPLDNAPITMERRETVVLTTFVGPILQDEGKPWLFRQGIGIRQMINAEVRANELADAFTRQDPQSVAQYVFDLFRADATEEMASMVNPTLVIAAVSDELLNQGYGTPEMRRQWEASLLGAEDATLHYMQDADHFAFENDPEAFDRLVNEFIAEHATPISDAE